MRRITNRLVVVLGGATLVAVGALTAPTVARADAAVCTSLTDPVYQRVNPSTKSSFLSDSASEASAMVDQGFSTNAGTPFAVSTTSDDGLRGVHQLYREATGDYLYTISTNEVASATRRGNYVDQGISFYATTAGADCGIAVYRVRGFGQHRLVVGTAGRDDLVDNGWRDEGVAFYAAATTAQAPEPVTSDPKFSFAVMPDTQQEVLKDGDPRFRNRTEWLARNEASLDLRFVTSSGDVVNWDTADHAQYEVASDAMKPLEDADIPYSLAIGNHDTAAVCAGGAACDPTRTSVLFRDTSTFNDYFTASRFGAVKGAYEAGKVDNEYSSFTAGGAKWMVLVLEMWPRPGAVAWAKNVVAAHPDQNVILVTHSYLDESGNISDAPEGSGRTTPQALFDDLVKQYPNVKLVFSGHVGALANRTDTGVNGNKIYSFLETFHDVKTNPVRLVTIDTKAATLKTWVYSPYTDATYSGSEVNISGLSLVH